LNIRTVGAVAAIAALFILGSVVSRLLYPERAPVVAQLGGETMGTTWSARLVVPDGANALVEAARDTIIERLERVNRSMSTWDPDSEISTFNRHSSTDSFSVSTDFAEVVWRAGAVSEATEGAFDVTVAPLVEAWGFGAGGEPRIPMDSAAVAEARERVGYERLHASVEAGSLRKDDPRLEIDLSAIAKGFAVDLAAAGLDGLGLASYAIEVGGEVKARGRKPDGNSWRVGIEAPDATARRIHRSISLYDAAIATSGDYRNWYESGDTRYAHIIDPRTGRPVAWLGFSVTVVHPSATLADAWATGLSVLGPDAGIVVADREGIAALYVLSGPDGGYAERASASWEPFESDSDPEGKASNEARAAIPRTNGMTAAGISWGQNGIPTRKTAARTVVSNM
jgi:thiamine biosynthesis lipoprotein